MRINEIYTSIEGEGIRTGEIVTFIRLSGCNLCCFYCDSSYAYKGTDMSIEDIVKQVKTEGVTITGGEPLRQKECLFLVKELLKKEKQINIETNGSKDISEYLLDNVIVTMDWKTPSSGQNKKMLYSNLKKLRKNDVLKIVCSKRDLKYVQKFLQKNNIKSYIYLSPVFGELNPKKLIKFAKKNYSPKLRTQIQLHKIIWNPNKRGV